MFAFDASVQIGVQRWGEFFLHGTNSQIGDYEGSTVPAPPSGSEQPGVLEALAKQHSNLIVPHLDAISDVDRAFTAFTHENCLLGFHHHTYTL